MPSTPPRPVRAALTAVATAAVATVALAAAAGCGGTDDTTVTEPEFDKNTKLDCPASAKPPGEPKSGGPAKLVDGGAVVARLCPVKTSETKGMPESDDGLTSQTLNTGVGALINAVNALPDARSDPICTMEIGSTYLLVLGYPNGHTEELTFESFGCGVVQAGDNFSQGGRELRTTYSDLLQTQKAEQDKTPR